MERHLTMAQSAQDLEISAQAPPPNGRPAKKVRRSAGEA
jgi:hypothetical protein